MEPKFELGQKVKCVSDWSDAAVNPLGQFGVIEQICDVTLPWPYYVRFDNPDLERGGITSFPDQLGLWPLGEDELEPIA